MSCVFTSHQKVVLEIDFAGCLRGYTEINILPTTKDLRTIFLHSRQCDIENVTVASHPAEFVHHDAVANLHVSDRTDFHLYPEVKRKLYSALAEGDEGELAIAIPPQVSIRQSGNAVSANVTSEAATPEPSTPGPSMSAPMLPEFSPIIIVIEYTLRHPTDGIQFVIPTEAYPQHIPHVYTTPSGPDAARCWVPCVDSLWERCTWEFEFVVPKSLQQESNSMTDMDLEEYATDGSEHPVTVICSGDFVEQVSHPFNSSKTLFLFAQGIATSVQQIGFAAGPFHVLPISSSDSDDAAAQTVMHAFCPAGYEFLLQPTISSLRSAMNFYSTEFGSYPFGSHKIVFVQELPQSRFDTATLSLVHTDLMHGEDAIDQVFETRHALSHALACQWVGINIYQKAWSDTWLINGLGLYVNGLFMRRVMGNNDYRFKLKKDMERIIERDTGEMPPVCQPGIYEPPDSSVLPFINLKAPLVLHILDRRLAKSGTSLGLSRILPKIFLSAISGELPNNALSTHSFLRTCRKVSGVDPRSFAEQWIYGSGCPRFGFNAQFNRKKMVVEITMRQESPAYLASQDDPVKLALLKPVQVFEGPMTVRIHEADGTPYEHVLDIRMPFKRYEVPFNTKYKRVRRNTKRFIARQQAAIAAAQGDMEAKEAIGMIDMGFGLDVWEQEEERTNWRVADWTEEDEQVMAGATYEWIRIDADFEWISYLHFDQPDFMWVSQLTRDRDVVAQYEAVYALARQPSAIVSSTLTKTVLVTNYYYRIRVEAAFALITCSIHRLDFLGLFHLFKIFSQYCYDSDDKNQDILTRSYVPKPNDFLDFSEYFVRKAVISAISQVRLNNGKSPPIVRQFLIDQLRHNDNTINQHSDALYICNVISALACACVSAVPPERGEFLPTRTKSDQNDEDRQLLQHANVEVERYRSMDRLVPSTHNVVTVAALEWQLSLTLAGLLPLDPKLYLSFTREGNETQVRLAAFDGLMLMNDWYHPRVLSYILAVIAHDPCRTVRRHVARCLIEGLAILFHIGDIKHPSKEDPLLIEEDGNVPDMVKESKKSEADLLVKSLRKSRDIGRNEVLRQEIMPILMSHETDYEVRLSVLKLADLVFRGAEESPPKVTIHIPRTPVLDIPPSFSDGLPGLKPAKTKRIRMGPSAMKTEPSALPSLAKIRIPSQVEPISTSSPRPASPAVLTQPPSLPPPSLRPGKSAAPKKEVAFLGKAKTKTNALSTKKAKPPIQAQASGMTMNDIRACRNALKKLQSNKHARLFALPVDPVRDNAPNYFAIIQKPMDLSSMHARLESGAYSDRFAFEADFRLMINNARTYNASGTWAHSEALVLESFFDKQWDRISKTIAAAEKAVPTTHAPTTQSSSARQILLVHSVAGVRRHSPPTVSDPVEEDIDALILREIAETPPAARPPSPKPPSPPPQPRPTIKLKFNGQSLGLSKSDARPPKALKPKPVPPVTYDDDDGAKDLLEEVLAIEEVLKEKKGKESRQGSSSRKERNMETHRVPEVTAGPSRGDPPTQNLKIKKSINGHTTPSKGKDKDRYESSPVNKNRVFPTGGTPINEKKCKEILKKLHVLEEAYLFKQPVDPDLLGCPTYYDEIKEPMDLQTMGNKMDKHAYATMEEFAQDMVLIFNNCRQFNPPGTHPVMQAEKLERAFRKEWTKVMQKRLDSSEKRSLQTLLTKLRTEECASWFLEAVDPVALQIPQYFDIIPKKDARDLSLVKEKLDSDKYDGFDALEADIDLMVQNAVTFNGTDSPVGKAAIALRSKFRGMLNNVKTHKRKEKDVSLGHGPAKKPRLK